MSVWAHPCRLCGDEAPTQFVAVTTFEAMPAGTQVVRVRIGDQWRCARVDRSRREQVEGLLVRDAIASDDADCPSCAEDDAEIEALARRTAPQPAAGAAAPARGPGVEVQAAAISLRGQHLVVVLAGMGLVTSPGEAHMAIEDLRPRFGGVPVVLMAQDEDGAPVYAGDPLLVQMLEGIPIEKMPWKAYPPG